jgi:hypothetical protein
MLRKIGNALPMRKDPSEPILMRMISTLVANLKREEKLAGLLTCCISSCVKYSMVYLAFKFISFSI